MISYRKFIESHSTYSLTLTEDDLICDLGLSRSNIIKDNNEKIQKAYLDYINTGKYYFMIENSTKNFKYDLLFYLLNMFDKHKIFIDNHSIDIDIKVEHGEISIGNDNPEYISHPKVIILGEKEQLIKVCNLYGKNESDIIYKMI